MAFLLADSKNRCVSVCVPPAVDENDQAESVGGLRRHDSCPHGSTLQQPAERLQLTQSLPALLPPLGPTSLAAANTERTSCLLMRLQNRRHQT